DLARGSLGVALKWIEAGVIDPARQLMAQIDAIFQGKPPTDLPAWFKTAADAEAAGFVEAGTKAAPATEEGDK
ncbi:MAG: hypothetical protein ACTHQ3_13365, partial [Motilibacteraceae bacterium]